MKRNIFVIDLDNCIGCMGCQVGCKMEHNVALGRGRIHVYQVGPWGEYPDLQTYWLPFQCQHCDNPICVKVCPTGASYKDPADGMVRIDKDKCIACERCKLNCPYECNNMNKELRVMDKCTGCFESLKEGEVPACARNCVGKCIHYGDINDPESEVSKLLASVDEKYIFTLENFDNDPSTRYILRRNDWQAFLPQEYDTIKERWYES